MPDHPDAEDIASRSRLRPIYIAFAIGGFIDWYFNRPSETHWVVVMAIFLALMALEYLYTIQERLKAIQGKLDAILKSKN
jgi:hypothetical protein